MSLITSVAEAEAIKQQGRTTAAAKGQSTGFNSVLRDGLSGISEDMDKIFEDAAAKYGLSSNLLRAVAKAESDFNPNAVSRSGAVGVMQLMPGTAKLLGVTDSYDARQNIMGGAKYLKENMDRFGDVKLALAAYNAGPNSVKKYGGVPPFNETQNYVKKIMSYMEGTPLYANKSVKTGGSSALSTGAGSENSGTGAIYSIRALGSTGTTSGLNQLYGTGSALSLTSHLAVSENGDTITMDKSSFENLIQILRLQMMMNAGREIGTMNI